MNNQLPFLSILVWMPIIAGILLLSLGKRPYSSFAAKVSLLISFCAVAVCILLLKGMDPNTIEMQFSEKIPWIQGLQVYYHLGADALSALLITLSVLISTIVIIRAVYRREPLCYLAAFLMMQGFVCGAFAALDAILFYVFWEATLIPMFLIIGLWGGENRRYATLKFFLYTLFGSVLLLAAILFLHQQFLQSPLGMDSSFNILSFQALPLDLKSQQWLFFAFLLAFGIKLPIWPLHTWLPDAHVEAPSGGSMVLAGILLKMGAYGLLRFMLPIVPDASRFFATGMVVLSLIAIVLIALIAIVQIDLKKVIAYSSIAHMGFVTLGLFSIYGIASTAQTLEGLGLAGAIIQLISHGFISAALFLCVSFLYEQTHTRLIKDYGGIAHQMPIFATYFMIFSLANIALPGTSAFVGEFLVLLTAFQANIFYAGLASLTLILGALYSLWLYKRVILGPKQSDRATLHDIGILDQGLCMLLAVPIIGIGLYPNPLLHFMQSFINHLLAQMLISKI